MLYVYKVHVHINLQQPATVGLKCKCRCFADSRADRADRRKLFRHYTVGSYDSFDASR